MTMENILLNKAKANELAHFYVLEVPLPEEEAAIALMDFCHSFIRKYFQEIEGQKHSVSTLMDHPDVLVLTGIEEKKDYTVEDAAILTKFFSWNAVQSKRKFVVIPEAHRITQALANKWLKILEEPPVEATIFLLNPRRIKLLSTIQSRALSFRLPVKRDKHDAKEWHEFLLAIKSMPLSEFLENYSRSERPLSYWLDELISWETEQLTQMDKKSSLEKTLRKLEEMETFNQPTATKWTFLYYHLKDHVLPRLNH